ncbi:MAG: hypothetical protein EOP50_11200 [Sphingobacteriales bacterium]|nr:MAG: hypothetical protein EOP50_11200 [Sphingobacteriales bacterium]
MLATLEREEIAYEVVSIPDNPDADCIRLPNGTAVDKLFAEDAYVVQDLSSQTSMYQVMQATGKPARVWDVCSGAGGKSILLKDKWPSFLLTASDIRDTILHNLKTRFRLYNLPKPRTIVTDTTNAIGLQTALGEEVFNLVLCDVPCSGSGTWARTPEQFHFFKAAQLKRFEELQYNITLNASKHIAKGGYLAYVTCSVFRQENEDIVAKIAAKTGLECIQQGIINGIGQQADCMFVALFKNN